MDLNITSWEGPFLLPEARLGPQTSSLALHSSWITRWFVWMRFHAGLAHQPWGSRGARAGLPYSRDSEVPAQAWPLGFRSIRKQGLLFMPVRCLSLSGVTDVRLNDPGASLLLPDGDTEVPLSCPLGGWWWEAPGIYQPSMFFLFLKFIFLYLVWVAACELSVAAHGI